MKEILLKDVEAGMITAEAVTTKSGQKLADKDTVLSKQLIARFTFYHIQSVKVNDPVEEIEEDVNQAETVSGPDFVVSIVEDDLREKAIEETPVREVSFFEEHASFKQKLAQTPEYREFQLSYALCLEDLKKNFEKIKKGEFDIEKQPILEHSQGISKYRTPLELFNMIRGMQFSEDSIYSHSLNVALEASVLGKWLKFDAQTIYRLTSAALVHDIGKTVVPPEVLNKKDKLSEIEFEEIKKHTIYGNKILKDAGYDICYRNAALQHHERNDGSGYPRALTGDEIDDFAAIVALVDVYDAMTSPRPHRRPLSTFEVIEEFEKIGFEKYNTKYLLTFLSHLAGMHHNAMVMLDDGTVGRVVYINQSKLSRPIIENNNGTIIDLSREKDRKIIKCL